MNSQGAFKGRRVLVTGASRGLGLEICRALLAQGAEVIGSGRDPSRLAKAGGMLAHGLFGGVAADLATPGSASALAAAVKARWGGLDLLVNNAAAHTGFSLEAEPDGALEACLQSNLLAPHRLTKALLPFLLKGREPRILNVSSEAGQAKNLEALRGDPAYVLSKYSLNALTRLWAHELKGRVAVNAAHPGWVRSDMGGPDASDSCEEGARKILWACARPFAESGKFWFGDSELDW